MLFTPSIPVPQTPLLLFVELSRYQVEFRTKNLENPLHFRSFPGRNLGSLAPAGFHLRSDCNFSEEGK